MSRLDGTARSYVRRCFTLMELMAAVGILLGVVVVIGLLSSTATRAGRRETASSTVHQHLDQVTQIIRNDLAKTDPARGVLGIARVDIRATETADDKTGGCCHRADVLTLFTAQALEPHSLEELSPPVELARMSQVVYGHANFAKRDANGNIIGRAQIIDPGLHNRSDIPASQWHLARRMVGFPGRTDPRTAAGKGPTGLSVWPTAPGFLDSQWELYGDPWEDATNAATLQNSVNPQIPGGFFRFYGGQFHYYFLHLGSHGYRPEGADGSLLDGGYWWRRGPTGWEREEEGVTHSGGAFDPAPGFADPVFDWILPVNLFYGGPDTRTVVDPRPAAEPAQATAPCFLPGCSEFKVEYTYDDPREILVDPATGDPPLDAVSGGPMPRPIRWWSPEPEQTLVWSKLPVGSVNYGTAPPQSVKNRTDLHRWPRALRITIKAWDQGHRLTEPMVRVIVHGWQ